MRWPRRRKPDELGALLAAVAVPSPERAKPETPQVKPITTVGGSQEWKARMLDARREALANRIDQGIADALADAIETITTPYAQETTMTAPAFEPYDELDQDAHDYLTGAPSPTARSLVAILNDDRLRAHRELTDAQLALADHPAVKRDPNGGFVLTDGKKLVVEPPADSAAWLRDLADRLQQYGELIDMADPEEFTTTPRAIRSYADKTERQTARDTRDRERVTAMLREQATYAYNSLTDTVTRGTPFSELATEIQNAAIDDALKVYRAGRDDTVAAWQPGNGGGGCNPGPRGGQPTGQGGAHHA